ncbi:hypothetical protein [Peptoniphilus timonensis]|uniref:hypothetical protein n=1 Tax=Peptoniphilus timonensis TaxID=1268254 RepID=UPI000317609A|nr:hypothetical protein [Peptoniphilus timonensis]
MYNNNFFEDMMEMQKNIFEKQKEAYGKFMDSFNLGDYNPFAANMFTNNFKNPMEFFNNYTEMNKKFEENFREFFAQVPGYQDSIESYKKNMDFLNKLYLAYGDFL